MRRAAGGRARRRDGGRRGETDVVMERLRAASRVPSAGASQVAASWVRLQQRLHGDSARGAVRGEEPPGIPDAGVRGPDARN